MKKAKDYMEKLERIEEILERRIRQTTQDIEALAWHHHDKYQEQGLTTQTYQNLIELYAKINTGIRECKNYREVSQNPSFIFLSRKLEEEKENLKKLLSSKLVELLDKNGNITSFQHYKNKIKKEK